MTPEYLDRHEARPSEVDTHVELFLHLVFGESHSRRVTDLTVLTCAVMGMAGSELASIWRGAMLHDIGKIYIPQRILYKPGPLSDYEWSRYMHHHPTWGADIVRRSSALEAKDWVIPLCHHERWDGTGYPRGLKGTDIPIQARAFTPIDVFDALTEDRPYRTPQRFSEDAAWEILHQGEGTHFDPEAVAAFHAAWNVWQSRHGR
jgi:putative nucleotidyltransferase with HDIG domain